MGHAARLGLMAEEPQAPTRQHAQRLAARTRRADRGQPLILLLLSDRNRQCRQPCVVQGQRAEELDIVKLYAVVERILVRFDHQREISSRRK